MILRTQALKIWLSSSIASCECTKVEDYPHGKAIAPGAKGQIKVSYDTKDKVPGKDGGEVTLLANTLSPMVLKVRCEVIN